MVTKNRTLRTYSQVDVGGNHTVLLTEIAVSED